MAQNARYASSRAKRKLINTEILILISVKLFFSSIKFVNKTDIRMESSFIIGIMVTPFVGDEASLNFFTVAHKIFSFGQMSQLNNSFCK